MKYMAVLEVDSQGKWGGFFPDLPGVGVGGYDTQKDAIESLRIAAQMQVEGLREDGLPVPEPSLVHELEVA